MLQISSSFIRISESDWDKLQFEWKSFADKKMTSLEEEINENKVITVAVELFYVIFHLLKQ